MVLVDEIKGLIENVMQVNVNDSEDKITIETQRPIKGHIVKWEIENEKLDNICRELESKQSKETSLYDDNSYETLLLSSSSSRYLFFRHREDYIIKTSDKDNEITYEISQSSDHFAFFILKQLKDLNILKATNIPFKLNHNMSTRLIDNEQPFLEYFKSSCNFTTLKINSREKKEIKRFQDLGTSYLFNVSYNIGDPVIEMKSFSEFLRTRRLYGSKRNELDGINPPHRIYNSDLVYHYQIGMSGETPSLTFLSFYHIIEYFFEKIYNEELLKAVKEKLTSPEFSYKNDKEISNLVKLIQNKIKVKSDRFAFDEKEALKLVIKKYVSVTRIRDNLNNYDSGLLEHYKTKEVVFSGGKKIDFNSEEETVYNNISHRIYQTRNSIVHRKEGDKPQYIPYKHEKQLLYEIPLIKVISEDIIIQSSEIL